MTSLVVASSIPMYSVWFSLVQKSSVQAVLLPPSPKYPEDIWQHLETVLVFTPGGGGGKTGKEGAELTLQCTGSPDNDDKDTSLLQNVSSAKVEGHCSRPIPQCLFQTPIISAELLQQLPNSHLPPQTLVRQIFLNGLISDCPLRCFLWLKRTDLLFTVYLPTSQTV